MKIKLITFSIVIQFSRMNFHMVQNAGGLSVGSVFFLDLGCQFLGLWF